MVERHKDIGVSQIRPLHRKITVDSHRDSSENQFIAHTVPVKDHLKVGTNELIIDFASAFRKVCWIVESLISTLTRQLL